MRSVFQAGVFVALLFYTYQVQSNTKQQYTFGVFPYISPVQLVKFHKPLRKKMESILGKPVSIVSAPSFKKFIKRTSLQEYDFIMTAPHLGRLAEVRDKYRPIVHTMHKVQGVYLVKKDSSIRSLSDLKGKSISAVGRAAIITQMSMQQLTKLGMQVGKDVKYTLTKNHNSSMYAPLRGESDASLTGITIWRKITKDAELKKKMQVIGGTAIAPGFMIMAQKDVSQEAIDSLKKGLVDYNNSDEGKKYLEATGFIELKVAEKGVMKKLDPFIDIFLRKKKIAQ